MARLAREKQAILIAMHDPMVWETFQRAGQGWLRELNPISGRAVGGYPSRRGWK